MAAIQPNGYAASSGSREPLARYGSTTCVPVNGDQTAALLPQLRALGAVAERNDAELKALRAELMNTPPELDSLSEENALLAHHAREAVEETAAMRAAHGALKRESLECRHLVQGLQAERDALRVRLCDAERLELGATNIAELTASTLAVELRRGEQWEKSLAGEVSSRNKRIEVVELRAGAAKQELTRLEAGHVAIGTEVETVVRVAAAEAERRERQASELEAKLAEAHDQARIETDRRRNELMDARAEAADLQRSTEILAAELAESERHGQDTERKALGVARELFDTSQSIARLRSEVASQQSLQSELEEARREEGLLEQRFAEAKKVAAAYNSRSAISRSIPGGHGPSELSMLVDLENRDVQLQKDQSMNEALRGAWEAETREHRATLKQLEALQSNWQPLREWLSRLAIIAEQWRDELGTLTGAGRPLPKLWLPADSAWCEDSEFPHFVVSLCDFVETLTLETTQRLAEATARVGDNGCSWALGPPDAALAIPWLASLPPGTGGAVSSLSASSSR